MAFDRWRWLEQISPESAVAVAVKQLARMIADELSDWPPQVRLAEGPLAKRLGQVLVRGSRRPSTAAFEEAIQRVTWDLERNEEAIDFYGRNHHLERACPDPYDQIGSEVMAHYILEALFTLMDKTEGRVRRADLLVGLPLLRRHVVTRWRVEGAPPEN